MSLLATKVRRAVCAHSRGLQLHLVLVATVSVWLSAGPARGVPIEGLGKFGIDAWTNAAVIDFDADPDIRLQPSGPFGRTTTLNSVAIFSDEDRVVPGTEEVKGGSLSKYLVSTVAEETVNGSRIFQQVLTDSRAINTTSNSVFLDARTRAAQSATAELQDNFIVAGQNRVIYQLKGVQQGWSVPMWDAAGALFVYADSLNDPDLKNVATIAFAQPDTRPTLPTDTTRKTTPFYVEIDVATRSEIVINTEAESGLFEGFMPPQGNAEAADWPKALTTTSTVINLLPLTKGATPQDPLEAEPAESWSRNQREFLVNTLASGQSIFYQLLSDALRRPSDEGASREAKPLAPPVSPDSMPATENPALFLALPSEAFYAAPFPAAPSQVFVADEGELVLGIGEFHGLASPVRVIADETDLGLFVNGDAVDFEDLLGHGVTNFEIQNPSADVGTDPWSIQLRFASPTASLAVVVPEPSTVLMLGGVGFMLLVRQRESGRQ